MSRTREEIFEERDRLVAEYGDLFSSVAALLFRHDPVGVNFDDHADEYELGTRTILPKLHSCQSVHDVLKVVHEEFCSLVRSWYSWATGALCGDCF
jgi:hypothetical protein